MFRPAVSVVLGVLAVVTMGALAGATPSGAAGDATKPTSAEAARWPKEVMVEMPEDPAARQRVISDLRRQYGRTLRTVASRLRTRPGLDFERTTVKDVLEYLAEIGRFAIVFDSDLETAGIDLSARTVTLKVSGITYEKAIELVLPRECGYRVGPGYVLITTLEKSWLPLLTVSYSIRLHLAEIPNFTNAPRFEVGDVTQAAAQAAGGGGGAFGDLFGAGGGDLSAEEGRATPERIIDLVKRFVTNENDRKIAPWADMGGPATVEYMDGRLIVNQTAAGHQAVRRLLMMIE